MRIEILSNGVYYSRELHSFAYGTFYGSKSLDTISLFQLNTFYIVSFFMIVKLIQKYLLYECTVHTLKRWTHATVVKLRR